MPAVTIEIEAQAWTCEATPGESFRDLLRRHHLQQAVPLPCANGNCGLCAVTVESGAIGGGESVSAPAPQRLLCQATVVGPARLRYCYPPRRGVSEVYSQLISSEPRDSRRQQLTLRLPAGRLPPVSQGSAVLLLAPGLAPLRAVIEQVTGRELSVPVPKVWWQRLAGNRRGLRLRLL